MKNRTLKRYIEADLSKKMVFLGGPRQVGKTTLAKQILEESENKTYYLWDNREDRKKMMAAEWPAKTATVVLDELHKFRKWKGWLKGEYDKHRDHLRILVTGSARMDVYRRGGDSLQGRYHHYRLHPFTLNEMEGRFPRPEQILDLSFSKGNRKSVETLFRFSGFPEPILAASERDHRRWQKERVERFFREDVRDLENVKDMSAMQILTDMLSGRAASLLSLNSLREDLEVSHRAVTHWMDILERLYFTFRVKPFSSRAIRSLRKETKLYLWDWSLAEEEGARFENMTASHLLKFCHFLEDVEGLRAELFYLRDADKREVDFLVTLKQKPWFAVECKLSDTAPSPFLSYFGSRLKIPHLYQVVWKTTKDVIRGGVRVLPAETFFTALV